MRRIAMRLGPATVLIASAMLAMSLFAAGAAAAPPAEKGKELVELECEGLGTVTVSVPRSERNNGVGQVVGQKLHGIPVSFSFTATDVTTGTVIFEESQESGKGHGHPNQETTLCKATFESVAAEFFEGEEELPEGVSPTDLIRATIEARVIVKK